MEEGCIGSRSVYGRVSLDRLFAPKGLVSQTRNVDPRGISMSGYISLTQVGL